MIYKKALALGSLFSLILLSVAPNMAEAAFSSRLMPTEYTPSNYVLPKYDSFDDDYYRAPKLPDAPVDLPAVADFNIFPQKEGFNSPDTGTTDTEFLFDASASTDGEYDEGKLEVRWDFENDGVLDSYFSRSKNIRHTFKKAGVYNVKMEVLDVSGNVSSMIKSVTIVESTPPRPYFIYGPQSGTPDTIFHFDTRFSEDDQYRGQYLTYRFDWNGDGTWDTAFENKISWNHRFGVSGNQMVILEVRDPSGKTATTRKNINIFPNTPPVAAFTIRTSSVGQGKGKTYAFDATLSSDAQTAHNRLQYRWDFDYHGPNDIVANTSWNYADHQSTTFYLPGHKTVRLEVKDESGAITYSYATIEVSADETVLEQYQRYIVPGTMGA